jgi:anti-sigma factor RsiW
MAVNDNDLELLDAYLDDALEPSEIESLRARLTADAALVATLEQIRAERTMRRNLFVALEPDAAAVTALVANVRRSVIERNRQPGHWLRPARFAVAAAACVAIGFFSRGLFDRPQPKDNVAAGKGETAAVQRVTTYEVKIRDDAGRVVAVQRFDSIDKAREFAADLSRWQAGSERLAGGKFVVTADRF